nr:MAG TPA: hypothetical protein [Caudoviricetes sp.]
MKNNSYMKFFSFDSPPFLWYNLPLREVLI